MADYFSILVSQFGIPLWFLIIILLWTLVWKLIALWKSSRNKHIAWFIVLAVINTVGILPILYIYFFQNLGKKKKTKKKVKKKK